MWHLRCPLSRSLQPLLAPFCHKKMNSRSPSRSSSSSNQWIIVALVLLSTVVPFTHCCSSRRMPQQRPSFSTVLRPSVTSSTTYTEPSMSPSNSAANYANSHQGGTRVSPSSSSSSSIKSSISTSTSLVAPQSSQYLPSSSSSSYYNPVSSSYFPNRRLPSPNVDDYEESQINVQNQKQQPERPYYDSKFNLVTTETQVTSSSVAVVTILTVHDSNCTSEYKKDYCLNNGICFNYTIQQNYTLLSCLCADGFYGERCEDKYLEGSYTNRLVPNIHIASIQYGFVVALALVIILFYVRKLVAKPTEK